MNWIKSGLLAIIISFSLLSCNNSSNENQSNSGMLEDTASPKQQEVAQAYVCPMHPEVTSDQPGQCTKCGMDLVKSDNSGKSGDGDGQTHEEDGHTHDDNADSRIGK